MPIDRQLLTENTAGDAELAGQLLTIYIERSINVVETLRGCDPAAGNRLADLAHGMRGSALAIGANTFAELALQCERTFRSEDVAARASARDVLVGAIEASAREAAAALPAGR